MTVAGFGGGAATSNEEKLLVMASEQAIDALAVQLNDQASRLAALPASLPTTTAVVADVFGNQVILNKGSQDGYRVGMNVAIERVVRDVLDPQTGAVLRQITEPAGQIQLTEVDGGSSVGRITSGTGFSIGDVAKPVQ